MSFGKSSIFDKCQFSNEFFEKFGTFEIFWLITIISNLQLVSYKAVILYKGNGKRPLSQDPIMEMNGESSVSPTLGLMNSKPTYLDSNSQAINSTLEQMAAELENARNRISSLNNQLNSNVI